MPAGWWTDTMPKVWKTVKEMLLEEHPEYADADDDDEAAEDEEAAEDDEAAENDESDDVAWK
eukprot:7269407-Prymnesium_polylepis.2